MKYRNPRCILHLPDGRRCPHPAAQGNWDLFACNRHGLITLALLDDGTSVEARRMLAYAKWTTVWQGQRLINQMRGRAASTQCLR